MTGTATPDTINEFLLTNRDFEWLRRAASDYSGIMLPEAKRNMIYGRLSKRLRALGLRKFSEYRTLLERSDSAEFGEFINSLTTNLTAFFREPHHFEHLTRVALPACMEARRRRGKGKRLRIWSAGCSTGQEPYTIMMAIRGQLAAAADWDIRVLATDLDTQVLARAKRGEYPAESVEELEPELRRRWFWRGAGEFAGRVKVKPELAQGIEFRQLNLVQPWANPWGEPVDVIFCRNVVIYFDKAAQRGLFERFANCLTAGGYFYQGHSETLFQLSNRFEAAGRTVYRLSGGE